MKPSIIREYGSIEEYKKTLRNQVIVRKMRQQAVASSNIQIHKDVKTFIDKQMQMNTAKLNTKLLTF